MGRCFEASNERLATRAPTATRIGDQGGCKQGRRRVDARGEGKIKADSFKGGADPSRVRLL